MERKLATKPSYLVEKKTEKVNEGDDPKAQLLKWLKTTKTLVKQKGTSIAIATGDKYSVLVKVVGFDK